MSCEFSVSDIITSIMICVFFYCTTFVSLVLFFFFVYCSVDHRDLHVLTHSFPTRRSSDLLPCCAAARLRRRASDKECGRGPRPSPSSATGRCRSEEHTSELQSLMRISYAVFCLKKKKLIDQLHLTHIKHST